MKIKMYNLISECVERGVNFGYNRAHKHVDNPDKISMVDNIHREIMNQLCDYIVFDEVDVNE
jgi:hypothetical protein